MIFSFLEPAFMMRAFAAGTLLAIIAPIIGQFMVVRNLSAIPDTVAHTALLGILISLYVPHFSTVVSFMVTIVLALVIEWIRSNKFISGDLTLSISLVGSLSLVAILRSLYPVQQSLESLLFGSLLTISWSEVIFSLCISFIVMGVILFLYNKWYVISLGNHIAKMQGLRVHLHNSVLIGLTAVVVTLGVQQVGALLIGSIMVVPVATALQLQGGFKITTLFGIVFSACGLWLGLIVSWYADFPPGASITLTHIAIFIFCVALKKHRII